MKIRESEATFQERVIHLAELLGWRVVEFESYRRAARGAFSGTNRSTGWPDLTLIRERLMFRELKAQGGRVRPEQEAMIAALLAAGADAAIWRPDDWDEIARELGRRLP